MFFSKINENIKMTGVRAYLNLPWASDFDTSLSYIIDKLNDILRLKRVLK